jgi:predicted NBD/HSP70 family sugar kinase
MTGTYTVDDGDKSAATVSANSTAGDAAARPHMLDLARGTNQIGVRLYNERLVLSLIRRHGSLPKAEIARQTNLSAQTIGVIMRHLERDRLVVKQNRQRGKIGQPSVPFALNGDGAYSLGLKIGRRSNDLVLMDFTGSVRRSLHAAGDYPKPEGVVDFVTKGIAELTASLRSTEAKRVCGLGIAAPFELWNWETQIGAPRKVLDQWRTFDVRKGIADVCPWPVHICNDATAACGAELVLGNKIHFVDYLYFFVGSFIGGGVVLNGALHQGSTGNAGALGSMPVAASGAADGPRTQQLIHSASIYLLAQRLADKGQDASLLWRSPDDWGDLGPVLDAWIEEVAVSVASAIVAAASVIDFPAAIIDGAFPTSVRKRIVEAVNSALRHVDHQGLSPISASEGTIGSGARAIGAACLPLLSNFSRNREVLFKDSLRAN